MAKGYNKKTDSSSGIESRVENTILSFLSDELTVARRNMQGAWEDFDEYYDMLHCVRGDKKNPWEPDIYLPEFVSRLMTQVGNFVGRYFSSRDFVEPDIDSDNPQDVAEAKASKKLLNKILNDTDTHYYYKLVRLLMFVFTGGYGIIKGGYRQKVKQVVKGYNQKQEYMQDDGGNYLADDGSVFMDTMTQRPMVNTVHVPIIEDEVEIDTPVFDVYPIQNVYFSPEYAYSLNDKEYVIFESELTLADLEEMAGENSYFNLEKLKKISVKGSDERGNKTYNKDGDYSETSNPVSPWFIVFERFGQYPLVVKSRNEKGRVDEYEPGVTATGEWEEDAELVDCIITYASPIQDTGDAEVLIGFKPSPYSKRPMCRFVCYVDPLRDTGFGDGEMTRELQIAINDNFNLSAYRTQLATTPAFKAKRFSGIEPHITVGPEKAIMVENMDDLQELQIKDNIQGSVIQHNMLSSSIDYVMATAPQTMGASPERRETATMAGIIDQRSDLRMGLKSLSMEFIGFAEFYQMILTLVNDFMLPQTLESLIGPDAAFYNPIRKDRFKPVSQSLETEHSKEFKIKMWDQIIGRITGIANPKTPMAVNYILGQVLELMGGDFKHFKQFMLEESPEANILYMLATNSKGMMGGQQAPMQGGPPTSNQMGIPQSMAEQSVRGI